jgi:hypothetical protein
MLALLREAASELPPWLKGLEAFGIAFQGFFTPILIAVGGGFAWYKFVRQGEHDPRLKPSVSATTTIRDRVTYVFATVAAQNNGNVDIEFADGSSTLTVFTTTKDEAEWQPRHVPVEVFRGQPRVRPGETAEDEKLIQIDHGNEVAVRLDLAVTGQDATGNTDTWDTVSIVSLLADQGVN